MNIDDLERELGGLRPRGVSQRLTQAVSAQLAPQPDREVSRIHGLSAFVRRSVVLATTAALCGLIAWVGWQPAPRLTVWAADGATAPTMLNYQQAFAHSAESLEALLDLHAADIQLSPAAAPKAGDGGAQSPL